MKKAVITRLAILLLALAILLVIFAVPQVHANSTNSHTSKMPYVSCGSGPSAIQKQALTAKINQEARNLLQDANTAISINDGDSNQLNNLNAAISNYSRSLCY